MPSDRKFKNDAPIGDALTALNLLEKRWGDRTVRRLHARRGEAPYVEVAFYSSGYGGDEYTSSDYYRVAADLVASLRQDHLVQGTPHWGYTDEREMSISDHGSRRYWELRREKEAAAARAVVDLIAVWNGSPADFCLMIERARDLDPERKWDLFRCLAAACDTAADTARSWAEGSSLPGPADREKAVGALKEYLAHYVAAA